MSLIYLANAKSILGIQYFLFVINTIVLVFNHNVLRFFVFVAQSYKF